MTAAAPAKVGLALCLLGLVALPGCGGGESGPSEAAVERQIEEAKAEGAEAARRQARLRQLERKVRRLERQSGGERETIVIGGDRSAAAEAEAEAGDSVLRAFHAPSGNVSCQILSDGALCSVASTATTFSFAGGEAATIGSGAALPRGSGTLAPFGTTVSAGSIACTVPESDEPRGIACADAGSGHGFEASRVPSRQRAY